MTTPQESAIPEEKVTAALARFDAENSLDPHLEWDEEAQRQEPRELLYARRLSAWVEKLVPAPSVALRLAARCQHLCRWKIPRQEYPMTKAGYLAWRTALKKFHTELAGKILRELDFPEETIAQVGALNLKSNFPADREAQALEDALCLVFLQYQFKELAAKTEEEKMINALRKSWKKMSTAGRAAALQLSFEPKEMALLQKALGESGATAE